MHLFKNIVEFAALVAVATATPLVGKRASSASQEDFDELQRAAELSSAAYSGCIGSAFGVTITLQLNDLATDAQGYVGYDTSKGRITVVMRGSTTVEEILNDIDTTTMTPTLSGITFPAGVEVMAGVYTPWSSVHSQVINEVQSLISKYLTYTLESTGHSLGGALTYLSYIALAQNFPTKSITSNALAAFPIGNSEFATFGTAQKGLLRRGNNYEDGVPNMYTPSTHYGTEYYGAGTEATTVVCSGERDLSCSAGDLEVGVTTGHFSSFGIYLGEAGCAAL